MRSPQDGGATEGISRFASAGEFTSDRLTLARLLHEPPLREALVTRGADAGRTELHWCLTWDEAVETDSLEGVIVYARADRVEPRGVALVLARRPAAVVLSMLVSKTEVGRRCPWCCGTTRTAWPG